MNSAAPLKIIGLTLAGGKPWDNGDRALAVFDAEVAGFRLRRCLLIRTARDFLLAQPPKGVTGDGGRCIEIIDAELRQELASAAYQVFEAFGGVE